VRKHSNNLLADISAIFSQVDNILNTLDKLAVRFQDNNYDSCDPSAISAAANADCLRARKFPIGYAANFHREGGCMVFIVISLSQNDMFTNSSPFQPSASVDTMEKTSRNPVS